MCSSSGTLVQRCCMSDYSRPGSTDQKQISLKPEIRWNMGFASGPGYACFCLLHVMRDFDDAGELKCLRLSQTHQIFSSERRTVLHQCLFFSVICARVILTEALALTVMIALYPRRSGRRSQLVMWINRLPRYLVLFFASPVTFYFSLEPQRVIVTENRTSSEADSWSKMETSFLHLCLWKVCFFFCYSHHSEYLNSQHWFEIHPVN